MVLTYLHQVDPVSFPLIYDIEPTRKWDVGDSVTMAPKVNASQLRFVQSSAEPSQRGPPGSGVKSWLKDSNMGCPSYFFL